MRRRGVYAVECVVVPAFPVFGFLINGGAFDLHLSGAQVPLEIPGVIICIPETPFHIGEKLEIFLPGRTVGQGNFLDLAGIFLGNKTQNLSLQAVLFSGETAVAQAVAALIEVQRGFYRLPAGVPYGISLLNIEIVSVVVIGNIIVPIAGHAEKLRIFIEAVAAAGI